jgi:Flp pilus assembly protein TadB
MQFSATVALVVVAILLTFVSLQVVLGVTGGVCFVFGVFSVLQYYRLRNVERMLQDK